ncbi:hypothetical protein EON65_09880 [archaeon]|nr:MAG: hypothetical protein EON65_09880 [archaeon]
MTKQDWKIDVAKLCQRMAGRKDAEFFKEPVDWESLGLLDYPTIISKPMDLKTLRQNLDKGIYSRPGEFAADMRLIFSNAMTYNIPGSRVYNHAKSLGDFFETSWVQLVNDCDDIDKPPTKETLTVFVEKVHL